MKGGYELTVLVQDTGGRKLDPAKAIWAAAASRVLIRMVQEQMLEEARSPVPVLDHFEGLLRALQLLQRHFESKGQAGITQGQARKLALQVGEVWRILFGSL